MEARVRGIDHHIWQYPAVPSKRYVPAELADFGGLNFREALSRQNRTIYEVRDDTNYLHVVADTRRDLRTLLQKRLLRSRREIQLIDRCLDAAMPDQSPDGGTHVLPKRLTTTENGDFKYATNRLCRLSTRQNTKPPATCQPSEK
ncbi:hypothetical protein [Paraburkholderia xenovorans]